jgi:enoyl-CoA hydratase/carnithine racemase
LLCDIIYCSENSYFILPEIDLGILPGISGCQRLTRIIGVKKTMKMLLSSEGLTGRQAGDLLIGEFISS